MGGNSRTALVINCSPASDNANETTSTCRFGARAKTVKNHAKMNLERSSAELKMLLAKAEREIERQRLIIASLEEEITVIRSGRENMVPVLLTVPSVRAGGTYDRESAVGKAAAMDLSGSVVMVEVRRRLSRPVGSQLPSRNPGKTRKVRPTPTASTRTALSRLFFPPHPCPRLAVVVPLARDPGLWVSNVSLSVRYVQSGPNIGCDGLSVVWLVFVSGSICYDVGLLSIQGGGNVGVGY